MSKHDPHLDIPRATVARVEPVPAPAPKISPSEDRLVRILTAGSLVAIGAWGAAIATFGWIGLFLPALVAVPVLFVLLILITQG